MHNLFFGNLRPGKRKTLDSTRKVVDSVNRFFKVFD